MRLLHTLAFCLLTLIASSSYCEIYKTVDKNGKVTYTDLPPASTKAKVVELPNINTMPGSDESATTVYTPPTAIPETEYQVDITSPADGTTLLADERSVVISVNLDQVLLDDHFLAYFLDGTLIEETRDLSITLNEPARGDHRIAVEVMNKYGKSFGQSDTIQLIVVRPTNKQKPIKVPPKK